MRLGECGFREYGMDALLIQFSIVILPEPIPCMRGEGGGVWSKMKESRCSCHPTLCYYIFRLAQTSLNERKTFYAWPWFILYSIVNVSPIAHNYCTYIFIIYSTGNVPSEWGWEGLGWPSIRSYSATLCDRLFWIQPKRIA